MIFTNLIQANLRSKQFGKEIEYYQRLESTNEEAWELIANNEASHGMLVITDHQFKGKGRSGNSWFMSPSKGLAMSLILKEHLSAKKAGLIPLAVGIAVAETLKNRGQIPKLKWPNDILLNGKKVGGILCESKLSGEKIQSVVVGVGININETEEDFPEALGQTATSLFIESNYTHQRELVAAIFTTLFESYWEKLQSSPREIISEWTALCGHLDSSVSFHFQNELHTGIFKGIDESGQARIIIEDTEQKFASIILG